MAKQKVPYPTLDTPAVLVDMDILEANIRRMSQLAAEAGVRLRPHVKVHECADIARMQIKAGDCCGVEVGPVGQAEAMAEEGLKDIVVAHPGFYGGPKGEMLKKLLNKPELKLTIVIDMLEQAETISQVAQAVGKKVPLLIKIDLGRGSRYGVLPGKPVLDLANKVRQLPGIDFAGIYGHEMGATSFEDADKMAFEAATIMTENARMLRKEGIAVSHVSVGASSTFPYTCRYIKEGKFPEITECHPGNFAIGDIMYMRCFGNTRDTCAVTVLTTVMSTSHPDWAVLDAGYKTFGNDSLIAYQSAPDFFWQGKPSYGSVQGRSDLWFGRLSAETSCIYYMDPEKKLNIGERLEIVPNNATLVINLHDKLYGVRNGAVEKVIPVTGRGRGN